MLIIIMNKCYAEKKRSGHARRCNQLKLISSMPVRPPETTTNETQWPPDFQCIMDYWGAHCMVFHPDFLYSNWIHAEKFLAHL